MSESVIHPPKTIDEWLDKVFFEGWWLKENLNYLPKGDDKYQKQFEFDCVKMVEHYTISINEHLEDKVLWLDIINDVIPDTDIEIDYFINNNYAYALIFKSIHNSNKEEIEKKIEESKDRILQDAKNAMKASLANIDLLKDYDDPRASDVAKFGTNKLKSYIIRNKYNQSEYRQKRNQEIVDKYYRSRNHRPVTDTYENIAKDYPELSSAGVKKIIFSHDAPTPTEIKNKTKQ